MSALRVSKSLADGLDNNLDPRNDNARLVCFLRLLSQYLRAGRASHLLVLLTMAIGAMGMAATFLVGDGALKGLWQDMDQLMGSQITVSPLAGPNNALLKRRPYVKFTEEDLAALRAQVTAARYIVPQQFHLGKVEAGGIEIDMMVEGVSPELCREQAFTPFRGRTFSPDAEAGRLFECLVTESALARLKVSATGRIRVEDRLFDIVGVTHDPPTLDTRYHARVAIPFMTAWMMKGQPGVYDGFVTAWKRPEEMGLLLEQLRQVLEASVGPDCYRLSSSQITVNKRRNLVANVMKFSTAQSIFCVLVASIGVANVMLANVVRRSREYAIRIAMGARQADIFGLVLCESMIIGLLGGLVGIALAAAISPFICNALASRITEAASLSPVLSLRSVLVPLLASAGSGLLAGLYPALQTRRIDVLSILRAE